MFRKRTYEQALQDYKNGIISGIYPGEKREDELSVIVGEAFRSVYTRKAPEIEEIVEKLLSGDYGSYYRIRGGKPGELACCGEYATRYGKEGEPGAIIAKRFGMYISIGFGFEHLFEGRQEGANNSNFSAKGGSGKDRNSRNPITSRGLQGEKSACNRS